MYYHNLLQIYVPKDKLSAIISHTQILAILQVKADLAFEQKVQRTI